MCPSVDKFRQESWHIDTIECYLCLTQEILSYATLSKVTNAAYFHLCKVSKVVPWKIGTENEFQQFKLPSGKNIPQDSFQGSIK